MLSISNKEAEHGKSTCIGERSGYQPDLPYYETYAQIESLTRRRKITRARRRKGILEVRTASHDEWIQPVAWIEWINDLGIPIRYTAQDIR